MKAKIWNYTNWINLNKWSELLEEFELNNQLKDVLNYMLKRSGFNVLNFIDYYFSPQGYSAIWLLSESHFAIHTFPEEHKIYIELSSCNEKYYLNFIKLYEKEFKEK